MRLHRATVLAAILAVLAGLIGFAAPAEAASGPVFPVMNTSEAPPDGVYFRSSPHTADAIRIYGFGVFANERVQASCWQWGDAVGQYNNQIWYYAYNVSRPTVAGRSNEGWINTHYVNDGMSANHAAPGVSQCGSAPPPPPAPTVHAVYYSPSAGEADPAGGASVSRVATSQWSNPSIQCDTSRAISYVPGMATTLSGWSLGRLGSIYALAQASAAQRQQIKYILMIDPGGYNQMATGCDNRMLQVGPTSAFTYETAGQILANWLRDNPSARLVVMAGDVTADSLHPVNGYGHAGIQNFYFNAIRAAGSGPRSRTLVCNYSVPGTNVRDNNSLENSHHVMYRQTNPFIQQGALTSCPGISGLNQGASWRP
jgi:hypothetical protein